MEGFENNETATVLLQRWEELQNELTGWKTKCEAIQQKHDEMRYKLDSALMVIQELLEKGNDVAIGHFLKHGPDSVHVTHFSNCGPSIRKPILKIKQS